MRPRNASPTATSGRSRTSSTWLPGATPARSPSGMRSTWPVRKPTTSAKMPPLSRVEMRQSEPSGAPGPVASTTRPITSVTRPFAVDHAPHGAADETEPDLGPFGQLLLNDLARHTQGQLQEFALVALAHLAAKDRQLLERLDQRLGHRRELAGRLLAAEVVARLEGAAKLVVRLGGRRRRDGLGVGDRLESDQRPEARGDQRAAEGCE